MLSEVYLSNTLTAGPDYIRFFRCFYQHNNTSFKMLKVKRDINQQDFKIVDLHFVKSE